MSSMTEIVTAESRRLSELGIPYRYIHSCEGYPVVIVDVQTMNRVVSSKTPGRFVCEVADHCWSAYLSDDGSQQYSYDLSEQIAYRMVLGYHVGRTPTHGRYAHHTKRSRSR